MPEKQVIQGLRDTHRLWAQSQTIECALTRCIPCCYKLIVTPPSTIDHKQLQPKCHPNVRPELCLRIQHASFILEKENEDELPAGDEKHDGSSPQICGIYWANQKILVVGDGDFTFSLALINSIPSLGLLCASSFQSKEEICSIYNDAHTTFQSLSKYDSNVRLLHGVDATKLHIDTQIQVLNVAFDRIIFNFPCVPDQPGRDGQADQLSENKTLIENFIKSASAVLHPQGEIHVVHKTRQPFSWWDIPKRCSDPSSKCTFLRKVVFDRALYPEYIPRKVGENKSFPVFDAEIYCFKKNMAEILNDMDIQNNRDSLRIEDENAKGLININLIQNWDLIRLNDQRVLQFVSLLQALSLNPELPLLPKQKKRTTSQSLTKIRKGSRAFSRKKNGGKSK